MKLVDSQCVCRTWVNHHKLQASLQYKLWYQCRSTGKYLKSSVAVILDTVGVSFMMMMMMKNNDVVKAKWALFTCC